MCKTDYGGGREGENCPKSDNVRDMSRKDL